MIHTNNEADDLIQCVSTFKLEHIKNVFFHKIIHLPPEFYLTIPDLRKERGHVPYEHDGEAC